MDRNKIIIEHIDKLCISKGRTSYVSSNWEYSGITIDKYQNKILKYALCQLKTVLKNRKSNCV